MLFQNIGNTNPVFPFFIFMFNFPCLLKSLSGIDCPICGFQRSLNLLLEVKISASFFMYPPLIPSLILIVLLLFYLINKKIIKRKYLFNYSTFVLILIIINYVIKLLR